MDSDLTKSCEAAVKELFSTLERALLEVMPGLTNHTCTDLGRPIGRAYKLGHRTVARLDPKREFVMACIPVGANKINLEPGLERARRLLSQDYIRIRPEYAAAGAQQIIKMAILSRSTFERA